MTGVFIIGFILFLGFGIALFVLLGGHQQLGGPRMWNGYGPHGNSHVMAPPGMDVSRRMFQANPFQSGNIALNEANQEEAIEVYKQQIIFEEEQRLYLNNVGTALIVIISFLLLFLLLGSFAYYYYSNLNYEAVDSQKILYAVFTLIPFGFLLTSLVFAIRAYKQSYPILMAPGFDKTFAQYGADASIISLLKDEESKIKYQLQKLIEQFNLILEINNRKQASLSYAKMILLLAFFTVIPLLVVSVGNYFNVGW